MTRKSVRIPKGINHRTKDIVYLDESGVADLNDKQSKFFILTGIIADNDSFQKYNRYYCQLKYKYLGDDVEIHSHDLFHKPGKFESKFIDELATFIDNIPFCFFTVAANKKKLLNSTTKRKAKDLMGTTFNKALSIYIEREKDKEAFYSEPLSAVLKEISKYKFKDINRLYPLEITYKEILNQYLTSYTKNINKGVKDFEIYFEESSNMNKILELTEKFKTSGEPFTTGLGTSLLNISFPNKRARYLGLELADIVSFGFGLSLYRKVSERKSYRKIWEALNRRRIEFNNKKGVNMFIKL